MNPNPRHALVAAEYIRLRTALLKDFPELADDVQALADTLEGVAEAPTLIAEFVRGAMSDEAYSGALGSMIRDMGERKARFETRAYRRREAAQSLMRAMGERKIEMPDFTASIRAVPSQLEIYDESILPDELFKIVRSPDRTALKTALAKGPVTGARMTNGAETISIRTK